MWIIAAIVGTAIAFLVCVTLAECRRARIARRRLIDETPVMSDSEFEARLGLSDEASRDIARFVREVLAHRLFIPKGVIHPDSNFRDLFRADFDGGDPVGFVMAIEDRFQVAIPDKTAKGISTVRMLITYVTQVAKQSATKSA
jgi:acyl carrier protein